MHCLVRIDAMINNFPNNAQYRPVDSRESHIKSFFFNSILEEYLVWKCWLENNKETKINLNVHNNLQIFDTISRIIRL
jgi:hypothetical protein